MKRLIPLLALMVVVLGIPVSLVVLPRVQAANLQKERVQDIWAKWGYTCTWYKQTLTKTFAGVMEIPITDQKTLTYCIGIKRCVKKEYVFYGISTCRVQPDKLCSEIDPHECGADKSGPEFHFFENEKKYFEERAKQK